MCKENKNENEKEKARDLQERQEELRRWFESVGDCV